MELKKFRWSKVYESSEEELIAHLSARSITAERYHIDELESAEIAPAPARTTIWCAEGSFTLSADDRNYSMQPGDAATLPPQTAYQIIAGISGCGYYLS